MKINRSFLGASMALVLVLLSASCRTIQYREVQSDFERAVEAETARAESPFVDWYQGVASTLTDDFIGKLDEKLRPNAWMLRGMSEWRSGNYSNAYASAARGTEEIERQKSAAPNLAHGRDGIVLIMLPGLVQDSQLRDRLQAVRTNLTATGYQTNFLPQFKAVFTQFSLAKGNFAAATPATVKSYWNFQVWRALQNWSFTLGQLPLGEDATKRAYAEADTIIAIQFSTPLGGTNVTNAIHAAKQGIPADHPYRRLIELEEKQ